MPERTIAIVGAGFSGSLLALHLQAQCPPGTRICLIERSGRFGPGLAHATDQPAHLLNVTAGRMSALPDQPRHFLDWLENREKDILLDCVPSEEAFVPRRLFGAYVSSLVGSGLAGYERNPLQLMREQANVIEDAAGAFRLRFASGGSLRADMVVLAAGNGPTLPPHPDVPVLQRAGLWQQNPWAPVALDGLDPAAHVLLIGTGLTMVDLVLDLLRRGHRGPITALSRNGRLPQSHLPIRAKPWPLPAPLPHDLGALLRTIRREVARAEAAGQPWHAVMDGLRPFTQAIWLGLGTPEKRRFLRHLRNLWDTHRHRMPPVSAAALAEAEARGQLRILAGRIETARPINGQAELRYRSRGSDTIRMLRADRVICCTGPCGDITRHDDALIQSLLRAGACRPDPLRLGLDVTAEAELVARNGSVSRRMFALGPMTKGMFWEITAVPDIRGQCCRVAATIAERCRLESGGSVAAAVMDRVGVAG